MSWIKVYQSPGLELGPRFHKFTLPVLTIIFSVSLQAIYIPSSVAQSVGLHQNLNLGFNPYMSPVFGYGLGLPFGIQSFNPFKNSWLAENALEYGYGAMPNLISKVHSKSFFKKLAASSINPYYGSIKNKLRLMKHPEYLYTPYGYDYGYGKHYGAAMVPNNPYKSPYKDYYNNDQLSSASNTIHSESNHAMLPLASDGHLAKTANLLKPIIKAGAILTTAALLGKKTLELPVIKLHPSGMIGNDY